MTIDNDTKLLDIAVRSAVRGHGYVEPNPMVGCVISDPSGTVLSVAHHERFGGPHAEVLALQRAGSDARNAIAHVTLEPCSHDGKTPPCVHALIDAGIKEVVVGVEDPNPLAGGGMEALAKAGIDVRCVNHPGSIELLSPFQTRIDKSRPWITLKWAQTADEKIATRTGESKWISTARSRRMVHRERGRVDAIMTGIGTVLMDDPRLTARDVAIRRVAKRIVIDRSLKTPVSSSLIQTIPIAPLMIVTDIAELSSERARVLESKGVQLLGIELVDGAFDLPALMAHLHDHEGIGSILVEAGTGLMTNLLDADCVDRIAVFKSPKKMDDPSGYPPLKRDMAEKMRSLMRSARIRTMKRGCDLLDLFCIEQ